MAHANAGKGTASAVPPRIPNPAASAAEDSSFGVYYGLTQGINFKPTSAAKAAFIAAFIGTSELVPFPTQKLATIPSSRN